MIRIILRVLQALFGLVLLFLSTAFVPMCGDSGRELLGALVGGLGGTVLGVARRSPRVRWFAVAGGVVGSEATVGLVDIIQGGSCIDYARAFPVGLFVGVGIAVIQGAVRLSVDEEASELSVGE